MIKDDHEKVGFYTMKFDPNAFSPWKRKMRLVGKQFIIPFVVFQALRTIIFPTFLDLLLLAAFIALAISLYY